MANIPLSEIPNAPQAVFNGTANPDYRTGVGAADQISGEAQRDIREGYGSNMQNPRIAGALGDATVALGKSIQDAGSGTADAIMAVDAESRRKQQEADASSGKLKFFKNASDLSQQYNTARLNLPPEQWAPAYQKIYGTEGQALFNGIDGKNAMTSAEAHQTVGLVMDHYYGGLRDASNSAYIVQKQDQMQQNIFLLHQQLEEARTPAQLKDAQDAVDAAHKTGGISPAFNMEMTKAVQTKGVGMAVQSAIGQQIAAYTTNKISLPDLQNGFIKQLNEAAQDGTACELTDAKGKPVMDAKGKPIVIGADQTAALSKSMNHVLNQTFWAMTDKYYSAIKAGTLKDGSQLEHDPSFLNMPEQQQNAVKQCIRKSLQTTTEGSSNSMRCQAEIDAFPPTDGTDVSTAFLALQSKIMGTDPDAETHLDALNRVASEMASNNGKRKPDTDALSEAAKVLNGYRESGWLGAYDKKVVENPTAKTDPTEIQKYNAALSKQASMMEEIRKAAPRTADDAKKIINKLMERQIQAGYKQPETGFTHPINSIWHALGWDKPPVAPQIP